MFIPTVLYNLFNKTPVGAMTSSTVIWETPQLCKTEGHSEAGGVTVVKRLESHGRLWAPLTALGHNPGADAPHLWSMYL